MPIQSLGSGPLAAGRRTGSLKKGLTRLGKTYFNTHPGPDNLAPNIAPHSALNSVSNKYTDKREYTNDQLMVLLNKVIWSLNLMADADEYILAMGLKFAKCGECVLPTDRNLHPNKYELYVRAFDLVIESKLIKPCPLDLTPQFTKPRNFLSFALAENCKNEIEIKELIAKAVEWKKIRATELLPSIQAYRVVNDDAIRSKLVTCSRALEIVGHKLHVKAHAIKHKESDAAADSVEEIPTF